jgi:transposase-like protein
MFSFSKGRHSHVPVIVPQGRRACTPAVKEQIVKMALNASGIRDTARVLHVSTNTVMTE